MNIDNLKKEAEANLLEAEVLVKNASNYLLLSDKSFSQLQDWPAVLRKDIDALNVTLEDNFKYLEETDLIMPKVSDHADSLSLRAEDLDNRISKTKDLSNNALKAANAYKDIIMAVQEAEQVAANVTSFATHAAGELSHLEEEGLEADSNSASTLDNAYVHRKKVENLQPDMDNATSKSRPIRSTHDENIDQLNNLEKLMKQSYGSSFAEQLKDASDKAENTDMLTKSTTDDLQEFDQVILYMNFFSQVLFITPSVP